MMKKQSNILEFGQESGLVERALSPEPEIEYLTREISEEERLKQFFVDVDRGLSAGNKFIPSLYFYDQQGSDLFDQITRLPEYYLTRCERGILQRSGDQIAEKVVEIARQSGSGEKKFLRIVELGAGDSDKPWFLIESLNRMGVELEYYAVDISPAALKGLGQKLATRFPWLAFHGVVAEYTEGLRHIEETKEPTLVLFLGSNIGNFSAEKGAGFLSELNRAMDKGDTLLAGFDLRKTPETLLKAYNDPGGVTSRFNLNLLKRINRELGGDFDLDRFFHHATYNPVTGGMESYLISDICQSVTLSRYNKTYDFYPYEAIHTEFSHKYTVDQVEHFSAGGGFRVLEHFSDDENRFIDSLWIK